MYKLLKCIKIFYIIRHNHKKIILRNLIFFFTISVPSGYICNSNFPNEPDPSFFTSGCLDIRSSFFNKYICDFVSSCYFFLLLFIIVDDFNVFYQSIKKKAIL